MEYLSVQNADKICLTTLRDISSRENLKKLQESLMENIRNHKSIYKAMDLLCYYIKDGIIIPTISFYNTDSEYEALMLWKASEKSDFCYDKFISLWDGENPIPGWKKSILQTNQNDIEINKRQSILKIIPESER